MPTRAISFIVGLLALALGNATPATQSRSTVRPGVLARAAAGESVRVVVGVDATFVPEGRLDGLQARSAQRAAMRASVNAVRAGFAAAGVTVEPAFEFIPYFPATVTPAALERLRVMPGVVSIEEVTTAVLSTYVSVPATNTPAAVAAGFDGRGWTVAVLDSGTDYNHSMLAGSVVSEACFSSTGISICPGGALQTTVAGSGLNCNPAVEGCDHGTHVASIAVGARGTSPGPGVAPGAWLIPMKVFHYNTQAGGILSNSVDQARALERVFTLAGPGNVNRIASVNMSLAGGQVANQAQCDADNASVKAAIDNLRSIGIATVIASGNNGFTNSMGAPACISSAISVGNTTKTSPFRVNNSSNEASFLSLLAPGTDIDAASYFGFYTVKTGTSMAAPHVAGAWAILKQAVPGASVSSVLAALRGTGAPITDARTGRQYPFINVNAARLALAAGTFTTPGAPSSFSATASGNTVSLSWAPPAPGSGGVPTGYTVIVRGSAGGAIAQAVPVGATTSIAAPVPNGVYHLSVVATNAVGAGVESPGITLTVPAAMTPPGNPSNLTASVSGTSATFAWAAPGGGGAVSNYALLAGASPGFATPFASLPVVGATGISVGGIPPGVYYVRVVAQGPGGTSAPSNEVVVSIAGASAPGAPTLNAASVVGRTVNLSWSAGAGAAPTSYTLTATATPGGAPIATVPIVGTSVSFPGVPPGTYYVRLTASNGAGTSAPSNQVVLVVL